MQNNNLISFLIVNFNTEIYVKNLCISIEKYLNDINFEILIWDNSNNQNFKQEEFFVKYQIFSNSQNIGFVKANNILAQKANGRTLVFINPDVELIDTSMIKIFEFMTNNEKIGVVGPQLTYEDGTNQLSYFRFPGIFDTLIEHLISSKLKSLIEKKIFTSPKIVCVEVIRGTCMVITKKLFDLVEGMNENLFMFSEETDLCYKIKKLGYNNFFVPESKVILHESKSFGKYNNKLKYHFFRSKIIFAKDNYSKLKYLLISSIIKWGLILRLWLNKLSSNQNRYLEINEILFKLRAESLI